ncbi:cell division protein ZapA [Thiorhodococcus minor]|uniref:Cell division protein ZapA n=1 Tax=Thiorhodococcus minor TaxID=57489 RepID=A0A6M0K360_9GAMM|nr:cell division protein ZapA [Thiorhodococcus minor]
MIEEPLQVSIKILEKEYRIACEYHEQDDLRASARLLDSRMREIRQSGRVIGTDRIAVMAALNIAHDLIQLQRSRVGSDGEPGNRLRQLQERINAALSADREGVFEPADEGSDDPPQLDASDERV